MTKVTKQIGFIIEIDTDEIAPMGVNPWIYQILNRLNYEHTITSVTVDDVTVEITEENTLYDLPLGEDKDLEAQA